ncbi:MAG: hypothetical protein ACUVUS_06590 [Thermoproteota archaeon]
MVVRIAFTSPQGCHGCSSKACLIARCQRGFQYTRITSPKSFCRLGAYCPIKSKERVLIKILSLDRKTMDRVSFQRSVPEVDVTDRRSWF